MKARIEELTNLVVVHHEHQGLSTMARSDGKGERSRGHEAPPTTKLKETWVDYVMVINKFRALEDDYMGMITTTLIYATRERALRDKIEKGCGQTMACPSTSFHFMANIGFHVA